MSKQTEPRPDSTDRKKNTKEQDGRELLKQISTLEEYNELTTSRGNDPDAPLDFTDSVQPQDRHKRLREDDDA